jgi:hypothetical protein
MNYNYSEIMKLAWQFVRLNGFNKSEALKTAWLNTKLRKAMTAGIVKFYYQKVDGSIREAYGTLAERMVPATLGTGRRTNATVQTYFDSEVQDWRCYKKANLMRIA